MFFWIKKNKVVLDVFTDDKFVSEHAQIKPSTYFYPEWFPKLPNVRVDFLNNTFCHKENPDIKTNFLNLKHCVGFKELYKKSFTMPSWTGMYFKVDKTSETVLSYGSTTKLSVDRHSFEQMSGFLNENNFVHYKLISPHFIKSKFNHSFMFVDSFWNKNPNNFSTVMTGVVNFKYQHGTNINFICPVHDHPYAYNIEVLDPLMMLVPLREDINYEFKYHLVDTKIIEGINENYRFINDGNLYNKKKNFVDKLI